MFAQVKAAVTTGLLRISFWVHCNRNEKSLETIKNQGFLYGANVHIGFGEIQFYR